ncbi:MAG: AMP-dependent synthetase, partial [Flavobacteriia bacterium]
MSLKISWVPTQKIIERSNIHQMMQKNGFDSYMEFRKWSADQKENFWSQTVDNLNIFFNKKYESVLDISKGVEQPEWLKGARFNIVDSCFQNHDKNIAVIFQEENGKLQKVSQKELKNLVNQIANGLRNLNIEEGDLIAIDMPMNL